MTYKGLVLVYELDGKFEHLLEVIGGVSDLGRHVAHPVNAVDDAVDVPAGPQSAWNGGWAAARARAYSWLSASGFVSSNRRMVSPPFLRAMPKSKLMAFAWPMWR